MKNNMTEPSTIFTNWKKDTSYKTKMGFTSLWPTLVRFKEGEQWPKSAVSKWKNFTFLTINQLDFIVESKKSNILSRQLKMVFSPKEIPEDAAEEMQEEIMQKAEDYTVLAKNTWDDVDQDQLNNDAVDDALTIGTGVYHYYFDSSYKGDSSTPTKGRICGHTIDAMDVALGNPQLKAHQLQKQPYIIIKTYEDVDEVKEYAKNNGKDYQLIVADVDNDEEYDNGKNDLEHPNKVVCMTMYYRDGGAVYWTKVTKTSVVQTPRSLSPTERPFKLYPVELLIFKPRRKCSFGRSTLEDSLSIQKAINFLYSMLAYGVQQTAWPKILAKAGAILQAISNEPGEIITDNDRNNPGDSVKFMQPPNFSNMPPVLIDKLTEVMRQTTNTGDVISGEAIGANMAASAIIALQNQAKKPNEMYNKQLMASSKRIGKIDEEFFKCYYILPRPIVREDKTGKKLSKVITPSEYQDIEFEMSIDVGAGGAFDEALQVNTLEGMYQKGDIDKYQYVKYAPDNMLPQGIKEDFEEEKQEMLEMQKQQGAQVDTVMSQLDLDEQQAVQNNPALLEGL